jgi:hypothetical protein
MASRAATAFLNRVRKLCLALPETTEQAAWGEPTFRVRNKIFVMVADNHHNDGRLAIWCKSEPIGRDVLIGADPERFFVPPYVGPKGWLGVRLDVSVDWRLVADIIDDSYRMIAPKRLAALLESR